MYTPILNNLAVIAVFLAFHQAYEKVTLDTVTTRQLLIIGLGTTAGVVLMALRATTVPQRAREVPSDASA